jgi:hypothetical protein
VQTKKRVFTEKKKLQLDYYQVCKFVKFINSTLALQKCVLHLKGMFNLVIQTNLKETLASQLWGCGGTPL